MHNAKKHSSHALASLSATRKLFRISDKITFERVADHHYGVSNSEQADVETELPLCEVPLGDSRDDERLRRAEHALRCR